MRVCKLLWHTRSRNHRPKNRLQFHFLSACRFWCRFFIYNIRIGWQFWHRDGRTVKISISEQYVYHVLLLMKYFSYAVTCRYIRHSLGVQYYGILYWRRNLLYIPDKSCARFAYVTMWPERDPRRGTGAKNGAHLSWRRFPETCVISVVYSNWLQK